jgi:hypothetical protein
MIKFYRFLTLKKTKVKPSETVNILDISASQVILPRIILQCLESFIKKVALFPCGR